MFSKVLGDAVQITTRGGIKKKVFQNYSWRKRDGDEEIHDLKPKINRINVNPLL